MIFYYSFTEGLPGTAVTARLLAVDRNAVIRSFNGSFGAGFTHYTTEAGERIEYPGKSWSSIKGNSVTAERADGTKMFLTNIHIRKSTPTFSLSCYSKLQTLTLNSTL